MVGVIIDIGGGLGGGVGGPGGGFGGPGGGFSDNRNSGKPLLQPRLRNHPQDHQDHQHHHHQDTLLGRQ